MRTASRITIGLRPAIRKPNRDGWRISTDLGRNPTSLCRYDAVMHRRWFATVTLGVVLLLPAPTPDGPYARIAILHPRDGQTVEFEAGYVRHLAWHQQAGDKWAWYGWTVTFGERQRWFVYATFGHSAASFDSPVSPGDDERDNVLNVAPHVDSWANAL